MFGASSRGSIYRAPANVQSLTQDFLSLDPAAGKVQRREQQQQKVYTTHSLHQLKMWGSHTLEQHIAVKNHASISIKVRNKTNTPTRTTTRNIFLEFSVNTRETPEE